MKTILYLLEEYLRKYPSPSKISALPGLFKLNYVYSSPYTDSKHNKQVLYPISTLEPQRVIQNTKKEIIYNEKGRIEESQSFDTILIKDKHEKVLQDDVFGKASHNKDFSRWVYIAQVKQEPLKSYFNQGKGKQVYQHDLGERFDEIREVGIFVWDKTHKKAWRVEVDKELIPACPSFVNDEGSEIIFHAYQRQHFGHGIIHCFNRPVSIYRAQLSLVPKEPKINGKEQKQSKPDEKPELNLNGKITRIINDKLETNIFPSISPCFNYLVYLSGSGITHTYYLDFVIMKRSNNEWVQTHRIPQKFIGYYDTLKNYIIKDGERTYAISQTLEKTCHQIYKIDLETGDYVNLTQSYPNYDFCISDVESNGIITGTATSTNVNVFFYSDGKDIRVIDPANGQDFSQKDYFQPIHAIYVQAKEQQIHEDFKERAKKRPLLVMPHGGPHGSFIQALTSMRYVLLKMGYGLLMPNFSGSAGYGKDHLSGALKSIGQKDSKEIIDLLNIVLADNPQVDKTRVHLQGGSYGGYMSAILGSRYPQYFKSAIILNGVLNIIANLWFTDIPEWNLAQTLGRSTLAGLTEEDYLSMWRQSPIVNPMAIPTLQFLGAKDRRVPYKQGLFFDAITKAAATPITTYVYENSNHGLADSVETSMDIVVKSIVFLEGVNAKQKKE